MILRKFRALIFATVTLCLLGDGASATALQTDPYYCPAYPEDESEVFDRRSNKLVTQTGERIFPFGFYDLSWVGTVEEQRAVYERIRDAGFNAMYFALTSEDDDMLDDAAENGIHFIAESHDPYGVDLPIYEYDTHPALLGWLIADDFNNPSSPFTPAVVNQLNQELKAKTPNKASYISGSPHRLYEYNDYADIIGVQSYSIPYQPLSDFSRAYSCAIQHIKDDTETTVIANLQAFPLSDDVRAPNATEIRLSTYQALLNGLDGILYYAYRAPGWNIESIPDVWPTFEELACEVGVIEPYLLDGILTRRETIPGIRIGEWYYDIDGTGLMVVVNTTEEAIDVSIPVSYSNAAARFTHIPAQLTLSDGALTGSMPALTMTVLSLSNSTLATAADCSEQRLDVNSDGDITPTDVAYVLNRLGMSDTVADVNSDNEVNQQDAYQVTAKLGTSVTIP